jgi:pimeloyl-ACP methyl ester carboxylesterase
MPDNGGMVAETLPVNGIEICIETFGEPTDPPLLLIAGGASAMDWWEDEFCRRLAAHDRFVIRYDHRDTGRSTSFRPGSPPYSGVDLANDALGVLDVLGVHRAHLVGLSMGGALAQRIAIERPHRVLSLTLMSTSPAGPDPAAAAGSGAAPASAANSDEAVAAPASPASVAASSPVASSSPAASSSSPSSPASAASADFSSSAASAASPASDTVSEESAEVPPISPNWSDRRTAVDRLVESVQELGGLFTADEPHLRRLAERVFDRTSDMAASQTNHWCCESGPPPRRPLSTITAPTLILHGTQDPLFPASHAHALKAEIPGARLVWLEGVGHEFPPAAVWPQVIAEIVGQAARGRQPA